MLKAYKYRNGIGLSDREGKSIFERDVNTLVNNQIYLPTKSELNDPTEGFCDDDAINSFLDTHDDWIEIKKQYIGFLEKLSQIGIYSLSNSIDNELLWAYYGSGHSGFAIEYDVDKLKESLNHNQYFQFIFDFNVNYVENIPKIDMFFFQNKDIVHTLKTYLGTKLLSWKHEEEYRLIIEGKGLFDIDYRAITGIYFGYRMQDSEIDYIMDKLKGRALQYFKMELIEQTYKFHPQEIPDRYSNARPYLANKLTYNIDDFLLTEDFLGKEAFAYKDKLIDALEIVRYEPLITKIYIATIDMNTGEPIFKIFAYTGNTPPTKAFFFKLDSKNNLIKIPSN